jgi:hypothetical protein
MAEDKPIDQSGPAPRSIIFWSVAAFLALALLGAGMSVGVPLYRARAAVEHFASIDARGGPATRSDFDEAAKPLGGQKSTAAALRLYLRAPRWIANRKYTALIMLGYCGRHGVPTLTQALSSQDFMERAFAIDGLELVEPATAETLVALTKALDDPDPPLGIMAAKALATVDPGNRQALAAFATRLKQPDPQTRAGAAFTLGRMGPAAKTAVPGAIDTLANMALRDPDRNARAEATRALKAIRGEESGK